MTVVEQCHAVGGVELYRVGTGIKPGSVRTAKAL